MLFGFFIILFCQLLGEGLVQVTGLTIPGPVVGIVFLLVGLVVTDRKRTPRALKLAHEQTAVSARSLLSVLSLMFVPAGVGIVNSWDVIRSSGVAIMAIVAVSTIVTMAVTVLAYVLIAKLGRDA